jgi:hypothetical protein
MEIKREARGEEKRKLKKKKKRKNKTKEKIPFYVHCPAPPSLNSRIAFFAASNTS